VEKRKGKIGDEKYGVNIDEILQEFIMCRLAIYLGPKIALSKFITEPNHSIIQQSSGVR
jgi:hypothetical protein